MSTTATAYSRASTSSAGAQRGPLSLEELSKSARIDWDPSQDFKYWLKLAEKTRHSGQAYDQYGDLENAFIEYAKASTLILEKIPLHRDYMTRLDDLQRATLKTKGQGVRDRMNALKPELVDRHNAWEEGRDRGTSNAHSHSRLPQPLQSAHDGDKRPRSRNYSRNEDTSEQNGEEKRIWYPDLAADKRRYDELTVPQAQPKSRSPRLRAEHDGILQRQREAEGEFKTARQTAPYSTGPSSYAYAQPGHPPLPSPGAVTPQRTASLASSNGTTSSIEPPPLLPLESPGRRYDGESTGIDNDYRDDDRLYKRVANLALGHDSATFGGPVIPPITTTSPPPSTFTSITYPQLMTQHQRTQGYSPSLQSMFMHPNASPSQPTILFDGATSPTGPSPRMPNLYQNMLPSPSMPVADRASPQPSKVHMYGPRETQARAYSPPSRCSPLPIPQPHRPVSETFQYPRSMPGPTPTHYQGPKTPMDIHAERDEPIPGPGELRQVNFPRAVLPRFIAIAAVNTAKNRETCGLLMGKSKGGKLLVTTLLIPKQYSTSDTCQMAEEELILEFSESRSLMTLGWIHTHPTQSCFMSSVDLHTHSGLQQMLPESFAVVCAPQHTPNFGIFRLTDPPGLESILHCKEKNAFHPHPDIPIYTDADKGHVQMKDLPLEIVDLR